MIKFSCNNIRYNTDEEHVIIPPSSIDELVSVLENRIYDQIDSLYKLQDLYEDSNYTEAKLKKIDEDLRILSVISESLYGHGIGFKFLRKFKWLFGRKSKRSISPFKYHKTCQIDSMFCKNIRYVR